jgi:hypothetical protein
VSRGASGVSGASGVRDEHLWVELWVSLASLLRSYTSMHGLNGNRQATVELGEARITVRHGDKWLDLNRDGAVVMCQREHGREGRMELTEAGRLRSGDHEEEMDLMANDWARELMA